MSKDNGYLEMKVAGWRREFEAMVAFEPLEIDEFEVCIVAAYEKAWAESSNPEAAWNAAVLSLGSPNFLALKFFKNRNRSLIIRLIKSWGRSLAAMIVCAVSIAVLICEPDHFSFNNFTAILDPVILRSSGTLSLLLLLTITVWMRCPDRNAVLAGLTNALCFIPFLELAVYNPLIQLSAGRSWMAQGITFAAWTYPLCAAGLAGVNWWWLHKTELTRRSAPIAMLVFAYYALIPLFMDLINNLALRGLYSLPNHAPTLGHIPEEIVQTQFLSWKLSQMLVDGVALIDYFIPWSLLLVGCLSILGCRFLSQWNDIEVKRDLPFPSSDSTAWIIGFVVTALIAPITHVEDGFAYNEHLVEMNMMRITGYPHHYPALIQMGLVTELLLIACQFELTRRLYTAKQIFPFFSWTLVLIQWFAVILILGLQDIFAWGERSWIFVLLHVIMLGILIIQTRCVLLKGRLGGTKISRWIFSGRELFEFGLLIGTSLLIASMPVIIVGFMLSFCNAELTYSALDYEKAIHAGSIYFIKLRKIHLFLYLAFTIVFVSSFYFVGFCSAILLSGWEFVRFAIYRTYKIRLVARVADLERPSGLTFSCCRCLQKNNIPQGHSWSICYNCGEAWEFASVDGPEELPINVLPSLSTGIGASCYLHAENHADVGCSQCGRLVCKLCEFIHKNEIICTECFCRSNRRQVYRYDWAAEYNVYFSILTLGLSIPMAIYRLIMYYRKQELPPYAKQLMFPWSIMSAGIIMIAYCAVKSLKYFVHHN